MRYHVQRLWILPVAAMLNGTVALAAPTPPAQPASGPGMPIEDYAKIPGSVLLLVIIGETYSAKTNIWPAPLIFRQAPIPAANKNFIKIPSDRHGNPELTSDHLTACGEYHGPVWSAKVDALDYYGYWKPFDALCDAAFYGKNRECALGNTPQQRFMGRWSDGVPVKELIMEAPP